MSNKSKNLTEARIVKDDEFYTRMEDIESEIPFYSHHFRGKKIYLNCDDPKKSNFYKYFSENFDKIGISELHCTHLPTSDSQPHIYRKHTSKEDYEDIKIESGDFRSEGCEGILSKCDIIISNPPFSLFREYYAQIKKYRKKFLIIGSQNAHTYKEFFEDFAKNKVWMGVSKPKAFHRPNGSVQKFGNICYHTNLSHAERDEELMLTSEYSENRYKKYENFDAIEVSKVSNIPKKYDGLMGVPISFLEKYCPNQFEIVGMDNELTKKTNGKSERFRIDGNTLYARIVIRHKR